MIVLPSPRTVIGNGIHRPSHTLEVTVAAIITLCFLASATLRCAPLPRDWWIGADSDIAWTNKSLNEIRAAADGGDAAAEYYWGRACFVGQGRSRDLGEAFQRTLRSAEQGYAPAQFMMARFCFSGVLNQRDDLGGARWASQAAKQGHADAMGIMGQVHEFGIGTPRNATNALEWFQRAIQARSRLAPKWLGEFYLRGEGGTARRTNYVEALRWLEQAASNGVASAGVQVADMCYKGQGTPPDMQRALRWVRLFADRDMPEMLERLPGFYTSGLAEPRDSNDTPTRLLRRAAEIRASEPREAGPAGWDSRPSWALINDCSELWSRYRFGIGTPRDYVAAARWMWQAYQEELSRVAAGQHGVVSRDAAPHPFGSVLQGTSLALTTDERLWQQAVRMIHEALDMGRAEVFQRIGESYRDGSAWTPREPIQAWAWLNRAAEAGYAPAHDALKTVESALDAEQLALAKRQWVPPVAKNR